MFKSLEIIVKDIDRSGTYKTIHKRPISVKKILEQPFETKMVENANESQCFFISKY